MDQLRRDAVVALRRLRNAPVFTTFSVVTLALGIGATTAIYSVVYAAMLRPPDIPDADRVVNLYHMDPRRGGSGPMICLSSPDYEDYRASQTSFRHLAAWTRFREAIVTNGTAEVILGERVGGDYFAVVGAEPALGRLIQPADDRPHAPRVMVLSDTLWRRRFNADPNVVGRVLNLGGDQFEIVGVSPAWFRGVDMPNVLPTSAWIPLGSTGDSSRGDVADRESRWLFAKGRLKPGRTVEQAQAEFRAIGQRLDAVHPLGSSMPARYRAPYAVSRPWFLMPASSVLMHESMDAMVRPLATTVLVAVALVLLVACTNIANLMLARATGRRHEIAVRLALGASRWRLAREQLAEAALVTVAGGMLALALAQILITGLLSATMNVAPGMVVEFAPRMNLQVAGACAAATALALVVFGLVPALHASRSSVRDALASGAQGAPLPRWRGRRTLIALQVTVSAGLVAVAVLCAQQMIAAARHDSGIDLERLAIARVDFRLQKKDEAHGRRTLDEVMHAVRLQPAVEDVALASGLPVGTGTPGAVVTASADRVIDGMLSGPSTQYVEYLASTPHIFTVLGVPIVEGRGFDERDSRNGEPAVVLSRTLAQRLFAGTSPVGRQISLQRRRWVGEGVPPVRHVTIVGVAADTDTGSVGRQSRAGVVYVPFTQHYEPAMAIVARTAGDPDALVDAVRRSVNSVDPELAILEAGTGVAVGRAENLVLKVGALAATLLGGLALLLAMAGLYGVLSDLVQRRTREIGVRIALGAERSRVMRMMLLDGVRPVLIGLAIGTGFGAVLRLTFRPLFLRLLPAFDPILFVLVPVPFILAALLASYFPARRAARVDPNVALRHL